jgi:16S rRNA (guanine527-N7)-methyltransferase
MHNTPINPAVSARLVAGLEALGLADRSELLSDLLHYLRLLLQWNGAYNLTAIRDPAEMVTRHILDSLALVPYVQGELLVDIGTGAGLPGMLLHMADVCPETVLVDSNGKKVRFCKHVIGELGLEQIDARHIRAEDLKLADGADAVISRAYASLADFVRSAGHLLRPGGQLLAMKGRYPHDEVQQLPAGWQLLECVQLRVPGLDEERHLLRLVIA